MTMRSLAEVTAEVWEEWARGGWVLSLPPDRLESSDDEKFWDEVERRWRDERTSAE